jgi:hypothetical protein
VPFRVMSFKVLWKQTDSKNDCDEKFYSLCFIFFIPLMKRLSGRFKFYEFY